MNFVATSAGTVLLVLGGTTAALGKPAEPNNATPERVLEQALETMADNGGSPPGQSNRPSDPDMGDDNAAFRAITTVCFKDTPAAERSAICDREPINP